MPIPEQATLQGVMVFLFAVGLLLFFGGTGLIAIEKVFISRSKAVWVTGLIFSAAGFLFFAFGTEIKIPPTSSQATNIRPANLIESFTFEQKNDLSAISLGVCNNSASTVWYESCYEAKEKLSWVDGGYNSLGSLGSQIELSPDKEQVYSFRWLLDSPLVAQSVSAKVFIPENQSVYLINLAAWTKDGTEWKTSGLYLNRSGWFQVWLDLQNGSTSENAIIELHVDLYLPKATQQTKTMEVKIDDVEFYYPSSTEYQVAP